MDLENADENKADAVISDVKKISFKKNISVKEIINNSEILKSLGRSQHRINSGDLIVVKNKIIIKEKFFPIILRSYLVTDFVFTGMPNNISSVSMMLGKRVIETCINKNSIVRFKTFSNTLAREDPLISVTGIPINFTYKNKTNVPLKRKKKEKKMKHNIVFLFDTIAIPKHIWEFLRTNEYYSMLPEINSKQLYIYYKPMVIVIETVENIEAFNEALSLPYELEFSNEEEYKSNLQFKKIFDL